MGAKILKIGQHLDMPTSNQSLTTLMSLKASMLALLFFHFFPACLPLLDPALLLILPH